MLWTGLYFKTSVNRVNGLNFSTATISLTHLAFKVLSRRMFLSQKLLAMNFGGLLLLMLQICYCPERCTSTKPDNVTKEQYKEGKPDSVPSSATRHKPKKSLRTFLYKKQKWPQPSGENFLKRVRKITKLPTTSTHCKIFCRSGYHLQILPNGVVKGTLDQDSKYGKSYNVVHDRE